MKHLKQLFAVLVFASLLIFTNCGDDDGKKKKKVDPAKEQATLLVKTWDLSANGAKLESAAQANWNGLTLTFTGDGDGGSYSTSRSQSTDVWPASGDWEFDGDETGTVLRDDGVEIDVTVTASSLTLSFTVNTSGSTRTSAVDGNWSFTFMN